MTLTNQCHCSQLISAIQLKLPKMLHGVPALTWLPLLIAPTLLDATGLMVKNLSQMVTSAHQWILPAMSNSSNNASPPILMPPVLQDAHGDMERTTLFQRIQLDLLHCSLKNSATQSMLPRTPKTQSGKAALLLPLMLPYAALLQVASSLKVKNLSQLTISVLQWT